MCELCVKYSLSNSPIKVAHKAKAIRDKAERLKRIAHYRHRLR